MKNEARLELEVKSRTTCGHDKFLGQDPIDGLVITIRRILKVSSTYKQL